MNTIAVALLAFVACANAGYLGPPVFHHHHGPVFHAPVVKHFHPEIYAVPGPVLAKPVVYAPPPVLKVLHHPAPVVKAYPFGPLGYGAYAPYHHHHHHAHHHHGFLY